MSLTGTGDLVRGAARTTAGLAVGGVTGFVELAFVLLSGPVLALPGLRAAVFAQARALAAVECRRLARYLGSVHGDDYSGPRAWRYLAARCVVGGLGAGILLFIVFGAVGGLIGVWQLVSGQPLGGGDEPPTWFDSITFVLLGALMIFLTVQGLIGVAALDRRLAAHFLNPDGRELLRRRVRELATSRAEVVEAVNDERRRIERDLHDGVQQRLVALGMVLGRARRTTDQRHAADLVRQAHEEAGQALSDLREVSWRVYPVALDRDGLDTALEALADRCGVPVRLHYEPAERVGVAVETVAYFVVSEAVTNAVKHATVSLIEISVHRTGGVLVVRVCDDGRGGADVAGAGLSGLARRVAAADGRFTVYSPPGGPTSVTAELPCE